MSRAPRSPTTGPTTTIPTSRPHGVASSSPSAPPPNPDPTATTSAACSASPPTADAYLVCHLVDNARAEIGGREATCAGPRSAISMRGGGSWKVRKRITDTGAIVMAWADETLSLDDDADRISIIAFDDGREHVRLLSHRFVDQINADPTSEVNCTAAKPLIENTGWTFLGKERGAV